MMNTKSQAFTYIGVLDDMVLDYPWKFTLGKESLNYLLTVELIHGRPLLLNDGYLFLTPLARSALLDEDSLLWHLIRRGFVHVLSRGGQTYGLHEMPERMASRIPKFRELVADRVPGVKWSEVRASAEALDRVLRSEGHLLEWPKYDSGSGFLALCENLRDRGATAHALGIGRSVGRDTFASFLSEMVDSLRDDLAAPRTTWETLVKSYANNPEHTNEPRKFTQALMNLANEIYHYNMGILLAAEHDASVAVQTQTSPAFDDLLVPPSLHFLASEVQNLPRLHVPLAVTTADANRLAQILTPETKLFRARESWLDLRARWETAVLDQRSRLRPELDASGKQYSALLAKHLGTHIKFKETEELVEYAVGDGVKVAATSASTIAMIAAGLDPTLIVAGTFAVGYGVTRMRKRLLGSVFKKFRVVALEKSINIPARLADASQRLMRVIKRRQVPSTIEITTSVVQTIKPRLRAFAR